MDIVTMSVVFAIAGGMAEVSPKPRLAGKEVFMPTRPGIRTVGYAYYTRPDGVEMSSEYAFQSESDKVRIAYRRLSSDNGKTWSEPAVVATNRKLESGGTLRQGAYPGFVDPVTGVLVTMIREGVLPTDNPLEGMKHWTLQYALSRDARETAYYEGPVVHIGAEYTPEHPLPGVWVGKNSAMIGDTTCVPLRIRTGEILVPIQITPLGPNGDYYNPGGGYTYHDAAVLIGRWNDRSLLDWTLSSLVKADPKRSTRGMIEPTLAELPDGRILMVLRGSNDPKGRLPGYRWYSISADHGRTWPDPRPWTYLDGQLFFSPSSCSQLLSHGNGRTYWIGNISPDNPRGNAPRYPLVIGEVDSGSALLKKETLAVLDDRRPGEPEWTALSNFYALEDRVSHEILVYCAPLGKASPSSSRPATQPVGHRFDWTADALVYHVSVGG